MRIFLLFFLLLTISCSGEVDKEKHPNTLRECKDFRDGEVFRFWTHSIKDVSYNPFTGLVTFTYEDAVTGTKRYYNSSMEQYVKCHEVKQ